MTTNNFLTDNSNAINVRRKSISKTNLAMKRFETIFDFYSEEPSSMMVKEKENSIEDNYFCILRIRIWNQKKESCSWSIYSRDREKLNNLIIRKVMWDIDKDIVFVKNNVNKNREMVLSSCPSIVMCNKYILSINSNDIIQLIKSLDAEIGNGFVLRDNSNSSWEWRDLEILRLYEWGQIHFTWCTDKKNESVEKRIKELILNLDENIEKENMNIFSITLNYDVIPD